MEEKTMVMKILDAKKIQYNHYSYVADSQTTGIEIAKMLNEDPKNVFKTLVTIGKSGKNYVFVIPVEKELDLKKAAKSVNEKYIEMVKSKDLLMTTGYIHGGCSPIGMKKTLITFFDESINKLDKVIFSGGKIGFQVELNVKDLYKVVNYKTADLII